MDIIAVLSALRGHNCAEGGGRRLLVPSASLVPELRVRMPGTGAARQQAFQLCEKGQWGLSSGPPSR
jgi:hypothetical protein